MISVSIESPHLGFECSPALLTSWSRYNVSQNWQSIKPTWRECCLCLSAWSCCLKIDIGLWIRYIELRLLIWRVGPNALQKIFHWNVLPTRAWKGKDTSSILPPFELVSWTLQRKCPLGTVFPTINQAESQSQPTNWTWLNCTWLVNLNEQHFQCSMSIFPKSVVMTCVVSSWIVSWWGPPFSRNRLSKLWNLFGPIPSHRDNTDVHKNLWDMRPTSSLSWWRINFWHPLLGFQQCHPHSLAQCVGHG